MTRLRSKNTVFLLNMYGIIKFSFLLTFSCFLYIIYHQTFSSVLENTIITGFSGSDNFDVSDESPTIHEFSGPFWVFLTIFEFLGQDEHTHIHIHTLLSLSWKHTIFWIYYFPGYGSNLNQCRVFFLGLYLKNTTTHTRISYTWNMNSEHIQEQNNTQKHIRNLDSSLRTLNKFRVLN